MAATATAMLISKPGSSVALAWPQVTPNGIAPQNLDLLQIVGEGDKVLLNVDYTGAVHNPAVSPTTGAAQQTRIGVFQTRLAGGSSTAQFFADAFSNPSQLDIVQVVNKHGGSIPYYLDYLGVAHGS